MQIRIILVFLFIGLITETGAELHDRGGGLIYDDVLDITWLQDANYARTSGFHFSGLMSWYDSVAWADGLSFGGFDDWRLASMDRNGDHMATGGTFNGIVDCSIASELECRDNELGYMFYYNLMGSFGDNLTGNHGLFTNINDTQWSGTEFALNPDLAWHVWFSVGNHSFAFKGDGNGYVWAVRAGDVLPEIDSTPNPAAVLDFGLVTTFDTPQTQNISVANVGYAALDVGSVTIAGSIDFTVTVDTCSGVTVAPLGDTCDIAVTFTPTTVGTPSATLSIPSNDNDENPVTYSFSATVAPVEEHLYAGFVESATGLFSSLIPPGSDFSGSVAIVSSPGGASTNTADLLEALLRITAATTGSTLFCFNYLTDCEASELSVPITAITSFDLNFTVSGCPANGTIGLRAFSSAFNEEVLITLDLSARTFFVEGNTLGTVTGTGGLGCADSDYDAIEDSLDNCTLIANPDQRDTNGDGYGNACDPDLDNNGIVNFGDVALWVPFFNTATTGDADFNGDGSANFGDYALYLNYFLQPPGPSGVAP